MEQTTTARRRAPLLRDRPRLLLAAVVLGGLTTSVWEGGWLTTSPVAHAHESPPTALVEHVEGPLDACAEPDARPQIAEVELQERVDQLAASRAAPASHGGRRSFSTGCAGFSRRCTKTP